MTAMDQPEIVPSRRVPFGLRALATLTDIFGMTAIVSSVTLPVRNVFFAPGLPAVALVVPLPLIYALFAARGLLPSLGFWACGVRRVRDGEPKFVLLEGMTPSRFVRLLAIWIVISSCYVLLDLSDAVLDGRA